MVLTCDGPDELFNSHKLVLNVPFSDSQRVRVFHARGEWPGRALSFSAPSSASQTLSFSYPQLSLPSMFLQLSLQLTNSESMSIQRITQEGDSNTVPLYR